MRLIWSDFAIRNRKDIFNYIAEDNVEAARSLDRKFHESARQLLKFPKLGACGRIDNTRELKVGRRYCLVYGLTPDSVKIFAVLNTAQDIDNLASLICSPPK